MTILNYFNGERAVDINKYLKDAANELHLGELQELPVQVAGGFMHRMFKVVTKKAVT